MSLLPPLTFALYSHKSINNTSAKTETLLLFCCCFEMSISDLSLKDYFCKALAVGIVLENVYVYALHVLIWHLCDVVTASITDNSSGLFDMILSITQALISLTMHCLYCPWNIFGSTTHLRSIRNKITNANNSFQDGLMPFLTPFTLWIDLG